MYCVIILRSNLHEQMKEQDKVGRFSEGLSDLVYTEVKIKASIKVLLFKSKFIKHLKRSFF